MSDETQQKILEAALEEFIKKGYLGSTTVAIAERAGFSEKTLFRKFETKQNLFDHVFMYSIKKMNEDANAQLFLDNEFKDPRDFLENYIRNLSILFEENFELFDAGFHMESEIIQQIMKGTICNLCKYLEKNLPHQKIDYMAFTLTISAFIYVFNLEKHYGRTETSSEKLLENFIENLLLLIE